METLDTGKEQRELEDWERHYLAHKDLTLEEKRDSQNQDLIDTLDHLNSLFGPVFSIALRNTEGEKLMDSEVQQLRQTADSKDLIQRIRGLKKIFGPLFYSAAEKVVGSNVIKIKEGGATTEEQGEEKGDSAVNITETTSNGQKQRVPRGFSRWDLKQIKLHESMPEKGTQVWVEYWSLKGESAVGEVLYSSGRDIYYFRPFDTKNKSTFPLTETRARKASREGRNFYFKKTVAPAGAN